MTKEEYSNFALRYKGCGACFPMYHTLSRFEKMWFSAIQKDVAELEKENALLKGRNEDFELQIMGLLIKYEEVYKRFPDLKSAMDKAKEVSKENAELRDYRLTTLAKQQTGMSKYALNLEHKLNWYDDQLTKAKELLERLLITSCNSDVLNLLPNCSEVLRVRVEAEQFLNSEVEK